MKKNSLGEYLFEKLSDHFKIYTDPKYSDNPKIEVLIQSMYDNMIEEVFVAWETFIKNEIIDYTKDNILTSSIVEETDKLKPLRRTNGHS